MAVGVRMNRYKGKPGDKNFRYKLPKAITKESISYALNLTASAHKEVPEGLYHIWLLSWRTNPSLPWFEHWNRSPFCAVKGSRRYQRWWVRHFSQWWQWLYPNQSVDNTINQSDNNDDSLNYCQLCHLQCETNEQNCMRCNCINQLTIKEIIPYHLSLMVPHCHEYEDEMCRCNNWWKFVTAWTHWSCM